MIYPPRNLPGEADKWGREVEQRLSSLRGSWTGQLSSQSGVLRATSGQLGSNEGIIEDLQARNTVVLPAFDMSVTGAPSTPFPRTSQTVVFPAFSRSGTAFLTIRGVKSQSPDQFATGYLYVRRGGQLLIRKPALPSGDSASDPVESQNSGEVFVFRRIPVTRSVPITLDLEWVKSGGAAAVLVTLSQISVSLTYSGGAL